MTPPAGSTSGAPQYRVRVGKPGDGAQLKPLWLPWLGNHFDEAMDSLDQGAMLTTGGFLELVLVAVDLDSGDVVGMLLAGPPHHFYEVFPAELRPVVAQLVVKLSGVAVAPNHRGAGIGTKLVRRAVGEFRGAEYRWMYGQFAHERSLTRFYKRLGFTVHSAGDDLTAPHEFGSARLTCQPGEQWFDQALQYETGA